MKKMLKNTFYTSTAIVLTGLNYVNAIDFGKWDDRLAWDKDPLDVVLKDWLTYLTSLLYIIVIVMMIYWGFNIITAGWAEDKVKKWKTILMQAAWWLVVVFLANSLVTWLISALFWSSWVN